MERERTEKFLIVRGSVKSLWSELARTFRTAQRWQEDHRRGANLEFLGGPSGRGVYSVPDKEHYDKLQWNSIEAATLRSARLPLGKADARTWTRTRALLTVLGCDH